MSQFAEASALPEAYKLPPPSIAQVDAHPDAAFIWSVILATRRDMRLTYRPGYPEIKTYVEQEVVTDGT